MEDINLIYGNDFGIAFTWKGTEQHKTQIFFQKVGLLLTENEMLLFTGQIRHALSASSCTQTCTNPESCSKKVHLESPAHQISFALNRIELLAIQDLMEGVFFELHLTTVLKNKNIERCPSS